MALCTRCGQQTEGAAEYCSGCGSYQGSGGPDRPQTVAAGSGTGYLRPFASRAPSGTALRPGDEGAAWAASDSGPQQWAADYSGNARFGTGGHQAGDPLTAERPDTQDSPAGGYSLVPRGPFEPARPAYPQDEYPDPQAGGYQPGPLDPGWQNPETAALPDDAAPPADGFPEPGFPEPGFPELAPQEADDLAPRFDPGDDPLTTRVPPEYPAGSGQYAPGPAIPAQRGAEPPYDPLAPYDLLAGRPAGYGQPEAPAAASYQATSYLALEPDYATSGQPATAAPPAAPQDTESGRSGPGEAGLPFPPTDDWQDEDAPPTGARNSRWITIAAAAVVLIICAATAVILLSHGKPTATSGAGGSPKRPAASTAPSPAISKPITVVAAAASGPDAPAVVTFLTRYFSAINHHNFAAYRRLFSTSLRGGLSQTAFATGYGGTRDSLATLHAITTSASGQVTAAVTFTSHQQPAASPNNSACTAWSISLYLRQEGGKLVLVSPPAGYQGTFRNC